LPVRYDATDDIVECGLCSYMNGLAALSISAWVKLFGNGGGNVARICGREVSGFGWYLYQTNDTANGTGVTFQMTGPSSNNLNKRWKDALVVNQWVHIACTWDGSLNGVNQYSANGLRLYRDGVEITATQSQRDGANPRDADGSHVFAIGNRAGDRIRPFNGEIAQVAIHNRVLTEQERLQLGRSWRGRAPLMVAPENLLGYWPMDGNGVALVGAGQVQDLTAQRAHGTPYNSPLGVAGPFAP
jgi:hypothetical protein